MLWQSLNFRKQAGLNWVGLETHFLPEVNYEITHLADTQFLFEFAQ